ncbi:MAG: NAD(P)H-dependent oxidoreductase [Candidatus Pelethousia sp.]|nr:NAD(P)H-dependent oxidoreductase [Candidatus Pelethousia sp.]
MHITAIYGSEKKGSTYHIAKLFIEKIQGERDTLTEIFLPRDLNQFCVGCCNCFSKGEQFCPHFRQVEPIRKAIEQADLVIFTTPVYALRASGQMKVLLDHLSFQYMTHRPNQTMFEKTALIVSTGAGGGTISAMKDIATSLRFWGMAKVYKYGKAVYAADWDGVSAKVKETILSNVTTMAGRICKNVGHVAPSFWGKLLFHMFRIFHRKMAVCPYDVAYWQKNGWLGTQRPWKRT